MSLLAYKIIVSGKVQGVYFRATTQSVADILGIKGFVQNLPNGDVYIEAQGDSFSMNEFLKFCEQGPEDALVTNITKESINVQQFNNFIVKK